MFKTERSPKYSSKESICRWIREQRDPGALGRGVRSDIVACTVITPIAVVVTYVCLFSSDYYNQKRFVMVPAARWTSISLLIMIGIMLVGYYLWVYSVIRLHSRLWYNWWQRECVVRYIPPSMAHICCRNLESSDVNPNNTPVSVASSSNGGVEIIHTETLFSEIQDSGQSEADGIFQNNLEETVIDIEEENEERDDDSAVLKETVL